ncbi:putative DCC family thiol-disulfide oxidoreductase YuxK [Chitinivorax tropicus]|uniref:Putative DCC family thiol-disulfide oxidoreductase YuxK n=1 Tax=Chitinivorax tropicus TaxID=714531 RepID=A0A840MQS6_9PROT|nr:DUF393 domain-containing protein [Chitinivorax tropicus]MBB5017591.1 putative DCC family thiol-disulfide oxidoreductase YuxK [Chitinivorax tropicus]
MVLTVFYDSQCPLCMREVKMLTRLDKRGALHFIDAAANDFDASSWGYQQQELMARLHALGEDGRLYTGMDAARAMYTAIGAGWLVAPTRLPGLRQLTDAAYRLFARHRLRIGRWLGRQDCDSGHCRIN